jgi:hypothetical protein
MADFEAGDLQRFFTEFSSALMRSIRGVLYLVVEEAHEFAPKERAGFGPETQSIHWAKKLATAGRSKGIRLIVATQRVQALHNAVLGSCETLIVHRLTTPADQDPAVKWLKANSNADKAAVETVAGSLSSLPTGTAWVCSGEAKIFEQVAFPRIQTFDNTATPDRDSDRREVVAASVDRAKLESILGAAIKDVASNDPAALKAEVARLLRELAKAQRGVGAPAAAVTIVANKDEVDGAREEGKRAGISIGIARAQQALAGLRVEDPVGSAMKKAATPKASMPPAATPAPRQAPPEGSVSVPHKKVLDALAWWKTFGFPAIDRRRASLIAGYSPKASTFGVYIGDMVRAGLIEVPETGKIALTAAGEALADSPNLDSDQPVVEAASALLSAAEDRVFRAIVTAHPDSISRAELADAVGLSRTASTLGVYLGKVTGFGFAETSPGKVRAADWLFPEAPAMARLNAARDQGRAARG